MIKEENSAPPPITCCVVEFDEKRVPVTQQLCALTLLTSFIWVVHGGSTFALGQHRSGAVWIVGVAFPAVWLAIGSLFFVFPTTKRCLKLHCCAAGGRGSRFANKRRDNVLCLNDGLLLSRIILLVLLTHVCAGAAGIAGGIIARDLLPVLAAGEPARVSTLSTMRQKSSTVAFEFATGSTFAPSPGIAVQYLSYRAPTLCMAPLWPAGATAMTVEVWVACFTDDDSGEGELPCYCADWSWPYDGFIDTSDMLQELTRTTGDSNARDVWAAVMREANATRGLQSAPGARLGRLASVDAWTRHTLRQFLLALGIPVGVWALALLGTAVLAHKGACCGVPCVKAES